MRAQRFRCMDNRCDWYARGTIEDNEGERARAGARHAVAALHGLADARVIWEDTRGINEHEATALRLVGERSQLLGAKDAAA